MVVLSVYCLTQPSPPARLRHLSAPFRPFKSATPPRSFITRNRLRPQRAHNHVRTNNRMFSPGVRLHEFREFWTPGWTLQLYLLWQGAHRQVQLDPHRRCHQLLQRGRPERHVQCNRPGVQLHRGFLRHGQHVHPMRCRVFLRCWRNSLQPVPGVRRGHVLHGSRRRVRHHVVRSGPRYGQDGLDDCNRRLCDVRRRHLRGGWR